MTKPTINRRGFLKLAGASAATTAILTGCGPASRHVTREPYADMPEYNYNGESTFYATTCQECAAGCGLIVRTFQGRAIKVEGNPYHPVNLGKTCGRGQATIQGLYNPDRVPFPVKQNSKSELSTDQMTWEEAAAIIQRTLTDHAPGEIAFLMGDTDDHLFDFWSKLGEALGGPGPVRFTAESLFSGQATLMAAMEQITGQAAIPHFSLSQADVALSFGASFLETWLSPVANTREYATFRKGMNGKRGYLIHFSPRMSQTASVADEWYPIRPGTETAVALAIGRLTAEAAGQLPDMFANIDANELADTAGLEIKHLTAIAEKINQAEAPLVIPGDQALTQANGIDNALTILGLGQFFLDLGKQETLQFLPPTELGSSAKSSLGRVIELQEKIESGQIKTLFVHGANPLFDVPKSLGLEQTLKKLDLLISFSPFPDETALASDYIFPAHTGLESWGYQRVQTGADRPTVSGAQPVVVPFFETQSIIDVFLLAIQQMGGGLAGTIPFKDEVSFLEDQLSSLLGEESQLVQAGDIKTFMAKFQQFGGWWSREGELGSAKGKAAQPITNNVPEYRGNGELHLHVFMSPILGGKGANKPWLQETPDPTTTVMWNTWIEINPETARELGIHDDDIVKISTQYGEIEAAAYLYPAIRPDTIAIPFGQGHSAYGRYAEGRGANPADLFPADLNPAGDFDLTGLKVAIHKTGKHKQLARLESRIGVYGFDDEH